MEIKITFQPSGRKVYVLPGTSVLEAAGLAGIVIREPCGGQGTCGKCKVIINDKDALACQSTLDEESIVVVPVQSMFESRQRILVEDEGSAPTRLNPRVSSKGSLGAAFDLGTTTVVGTLFDLELGKELAVESRLNSQISFGDDVVSRIQKVCEDPSSLLDLRESIVETINTLIGDLCTSAGVSADNIEDIVAAGNSTMQQILCGMDISGLGSIPFEQAFHEGQVFPAKDLGIASGADAQVYVFPQIDGFVGGDTVAGILASRLDERDGAVLFIDIGTNGEIVLFANGKFMTASTAAGPAFEGARIKQGMRAVDGAIEKVIITDTVICNVIGNAKPSGICGTALIDGVASLLGAGIIDDTGRLLEDGELPENISNELKSRLVMKDGSPAFVLIDASESASGEAICIWQKDIRELQLAAGAIRAGVNILLKRAEISAEDLHEVLLAGGFGNFIRRNHAVRIGLLPAMNHERIKFIGNASSLGAKLALLSVDERSYAEELRKRAEHVDLSLDVEFQNEFAMAMMFPEV